MVVYEGIVFLSTLSESYLQGEAEECRRHLYELLKERIQQSLSSTLGKM